MAISKERKEALVSEYREWINRSKALILTDYKGLSVKDFDALRAKVREVGGEFHVVKNTLGLLALKEAGLTVPEGFLDGSTAIGFAFKDPPAIAKAVTEFAKTSEILKIKGGYLDKSPIRPESVVYLAELPPLPVVRGRLLSTMLAPASKLARTLAEPGRRIAAVIKAYSEPQAEPAVV